MNRLILVVSSFLLSTASSYASRHPDFFSRNLPHTYFVETKQVQSLDGENESTRSFIKAYVPLMPIGEGNTIRPYLSPVNCYTRGNLAFYEGWSYNIAVNQHPQLACSPLD